MYDFDDSLADSIPTVSRVKFGTVVWRVLRKRYEVLELAEPYTPSALPQNLILAAASVLTCPRGRRTRFVAYSIENQDLSHKIATKTRVPIGIVRFVIRTLVGFCFGRFDRIVYGTAAASENYRALLGKRVARKPPLQSLVWGLPSVSPNLSPDEIGHQLVFLGTLDSRKGVENLMEAWPAVLVSEARASLTILGKGPLEAVVNTWARGQPGVRVIIDPPRHLILSTLRQSRALVLLSQPSPFWKEQIGLPIVEALSFGLEIIASAETGIADWLVGNGHAVIDPGISAEELAIILVRALNSPRSRLQIVAALPRTDGRLEADTAMFSATVPAESAVTQREDNGPE